MKRKLNRTQSGPERLVFESLAEIDVAVNKTLAVLRASMREESFVPAKVREMERKLFAMRRMVEDMPLLVSRYNNEPVIVRKSSESVTTRKVKRALTPAERKDERKKRLTNQDD